MIVKDQLDRLAGFEPAPYPVVSLYLNTQPGQTGRDQFHAFMRKELGARGRTYPAGSPERDTLDKDLERIARFLDTSVDPSANGVAIFACSACELFETMQLAAPIERHWLFIGDRPHLYPLARVESRYPRYAALLADTNMARILVVATGELVAEQEVRGVKTKRMSQGGWSQSRYQRHTENYHLQHIKEVVEALDQIVTRENIERIVVAGDEVVLPLLREQMPKHLSDKIVDRVKLPTDAPSSDVIARALDAMARARSHTERDKVDAAIGGYRSGGLGVVGPEETLDAFVKGQVDELLISSSVRDVQPVGVSGKPTAKAALESALGAPAIGTVASGEAGDVAADSVRLANELVNKAAQTAAKITFVEDPVLLAEYGGVAALLRFRI